MKAKINIDTFSKINALVAVCSGIADKVNLVDGNGYCVSAKSILGAVATMDWSEVFVECDRDIYMLIRDFVVE